MKRGRLFLEDSDWGQARDYFNKVLDLDPEYAPAYVGLLCADLQVKRHTDIEGVNKPLTQNLNYQKAVRFSGSEGQIRLKGYEMKIKERLLEEKYNKLVQLYQTAKTEVDFQNLEIEFREIEGYKEADTYIRDCERQIRFIKEREAEEQKVIRMEQIRLKEVQDEKQRRLEEEREKKHQEEKRRLELEQRRQKEEQEEEQRILHYINMKKRPIRIFGVIMHVCVCIGYLYLLWFNNFSNESIIAVFLGSFVSIVIGAISAIFQRRSDWSSGVYVIIVIWLTSIITGLVWMEYYEFEELMTIVVGGTFFFIPGMLVQILAFTEKSKDSEKEK